MDVMDAGFKLSNNLFFLQIFYEEGNAFSMFVRPQGLTQCIFVSNT